MPEICNPDAPVDDDCDGLIDDDDPDVSEDSYLEWYADRDDDGYGSGVDFEYGCSRPDGTAPNDDDCDDVDPAVGPPSLWYPDGDRDGFGAGDPVDPTPTCDSPGPGLRPDWIGLDCDDGEARIFPGADEVCEDGIDQDCDGADKLCIADNPECHAYAVLDNAERHVDWVYDYARCDSWISPSGEWFRFEGDAGRRIPEVDPDEYSCGTHAAGWLNGVHPVGIGDTVTQEVCYSWTPGPCWQVNDIQITDCGDFYVYNLYKPLSCSYVYCGEG
jgi:hypothetical protein